MPPRTDLARPRASAADVFYTDPWFGSTLRPMLKTNDPGYKRGSGRETTAASAGHVVFYTGNSFAAYSLDYGRPSTWAYLNMRGFDGGKATACCDQVVRYIPQINRFVWLIQYNLQTDDENRERLLVATPEQLTRDGAATKWAQFDITSTSVGRAKQWLDFPELVVGHDDLYLSANVFKRRRDAKGKISLDAKGNQIQDAQGGVVLRLPLTQLLRADGGWSGLVFAGSTGTRPAQFDPRQSDDTAYMVAAKTRGTFTVTAIDEGSNMSRSFDVDHLTVSDTADTSIPWLSRGQQNGTLDTRVLGATRSGDQLWAASNGGTSSSNGLTRPGVHVSVINIPARDIDTETLLADQQYAFAYPKLVTNDLGQIGVTVAYGDKKTGLAVGVMRYTPRVVEVGAFLPADVGVTAPWGGADYMDVELAYPHTNLFAAAGYTATRDAAVPGSKIAYNPSYTVFGAAGQIPAAQPPPTFLQASSIALACPSGIITSGQVANVSGQLTPPVANQSIVMSFSGPGSSTLTVKTGRRGAFSVAVPTARPGGWQVTARWAGDVNHLDSVTACSYAVSSTPPAGMSASSISLDCPDRLSQRSVLRVSGRLDPPDAGVQVGLEITIHSDGGSTFVDSDFVASESDGSYSYRYFAGASGSYDIQAGWSGDETHAGSKSRICTVQVIAPPR